MEPESGRSAQRERTRKAILDGARRLMKEGKPVTVAAAADVHGISKATAYRYFSDAAMMVAEAGLDVAVARYEAVISGADDLHSRLMAINLYFFDLAIEHEAGFRRFVGMTLEAWKPGDARKGRRRGARRIAMYWQALAQGDEGLSPARQKRLVRALAIATGSEAMIASLDIVGSDVATARATVEDVTGAILDRYLGRAD